MEVENSVSEVVQVFKEIQEQPGKILKMIRTDMPKAIGECLSEIMRLEIYTDAWYTRRVLPCMVKRNPARVTLAGTEIYFREVLPTVWILQCLLVTTEELLKQDASKGVSE